MRKQKVVIGFSKYSDKNFAAMAQNVISKMSNNPDFPRPTPSISSVNESLKDFKKALIFFEVKIMIIRKRISGKLI